MNKPDVSIIIPAKNENLEILSTLTRLDYYVDLNFECLIVVDSPSDTTVSSVKNFCSKHKNYKLLVNTDSPGPASAIRFGIRNSSSGTCIVTMADGSDDPKIISSLAQLIERGVAIAVASRYMPGGQQIGAPFIKSLLSRFAGRSLYIFRRVGTRDATNSFKAYSKNFIELVGIESEYGFEVAIELVAKAKVYGYPVAELPTIWLERESGKSSFKLLKWLPKYLYWYLYAFKPTKRKKVNA